MFFSKIPNIEYDKKPLRFPFSEREYVYAKNFFRSFKINDTNLKSALYYNKYTMTDSDRFDLLSQKFYGTTSYDWVILLTNNVINPLFDTRILERDLYAFVQEKYGVVDAVNHYETLEVKNGFGEAIQKAGLFVDAVFNSSTHKFFDRKTNTYFTKSGSQICIPVSHFEYEKRLNDERREIYILRAEFIEKFISQFTNALEYKSSSSYIDKQTKKSGI